MCCCKTILLGIVSLITISVCITQIGFSVHYIHNPVKCERAEFLTILNLIGGSSGILSTVLILLCCHRFGFGSK
ncbi:unnamed protein product [Adineta steineri]|uniref:Uncharacterized protein n=1 Tax=Adineta steineri TaxID=433720 RepID=A0A815K5F2_9BILA|nr:unnamed protein product [Adineta steineri]CAF1360894.1 unnamed protein product [Adineta steineri]CAF1391120.1 unnamed protein product [Adineta steineri]CAF1558829.1 unnamed protein product [Adineta steineri]CAF1600083.1 unnamed protein product [Adineta steineri]